VKDNSRYGPGTKKGLWTDKNCQTNIFVRDGHIKNVPFYKINNTIIHLNKRTDGTEQFISHN